MKALALVIVAGCARDVRTATPVVSPVGGMTMTAAAVGPITSTSTATLQALRIALGADYVVAAKNVNNTLHYEVSRGGDKVFDITGDEDGTVDSVRVTSVRVDVAGRPWHVGAPFSTPELLTACECEEDTADRTVCYKSGDHVAVEFKRGCDNLDDAAARKLLAGTTIDRLVWSAKPWGDEPAPEPDGPPQPADE